MGCQSTKCAGEGCPRYVPACKLVNGLCPVCYRKLLDKQKQQNNVSNQSPNNQ